MTEDAKKAHPEFSEATTYGSNLSSQQKKWRHTVFQSLASQTGGAILYAFIFGFIEVVLSLIDGLMEDSLTSAIASEAVGAGGYSHLQ